MNIIAFIFARGGSKGLPGKNIRPFMGKPLIAWAIEHAKAVERIRRVIVSTDSQDIAEVAMAYGAEVPFIRPARLATDDVPEWLAWRHAMQYINDTEGSLPDLMVSVPATSPLRKPEDIERCIDEYVRSSSDIVVTVAKAYRNPYYNMVVRNEDGSVSLVNPPASNLGTRQSAPVVYDMTTVAYVVRPQFIFDRNYIFSGNVSAVEIPKERSVDIDDEYDFTLAEFLFQKNKF